ncbi:MAG: hypothetical protein K6F85_00805, partial [Bacteroidales bacterium]|nr:hypothetical protein [Bacteroidales bacterium]
MRTKRLLSTIAAVVLCFAAMAQTETIGIDAASLKTAGGQPLNAKKANYNASIFAKSGDTLATFNFAADQAGYTLGTYNANNPAPATVSGRVNHAQNGYYATWHRMPNVAFLNSSSFSSNYPRFDQYFMKDYVSAIFTDTMSWGAFDDNG